MFPSIKVGILGLDKVQGHFPGRRLQRDAAGDPAKTQLNEANHCGSIRSILLQDKELFQKVPGYKQTTAARRFGASKKNLIQVRGLILQRAASGGNWMQSFWGRLTVIRTILVQYVQRYVQDIYIFFNIHA